MIIKEENVVQEIKLKNEEALSFVMQQYGGLLNSIIRKYLHGSQQDTEECLADVVISIWSNIHSYDPNKNEFKQWIAAIAKYKAIDYVRKSVKDIQLASNLEMNKKVTNQSVPHNERLTIEELLLELPEVERAIFEKYYVEGAPSKEIASHYNARESWVHNKLSRGRKKLRSILTKGEVF